jgi:hypothetical protein
MNPPRKHHEKGALAALAFTAAAWPCAAQELLDRYLEMAE